MLNIFIIIVIGYIISFSFFKYKYNSFCLYYNHSAFKSCPKLAIILPVTSKGNKIDEKNPNPSQLLLMKYIYPSLLSTIEPLLYSYKVYIGFGCYDYYLSKSYFLHKLKKIMNNGIFIVYI